MSNSNAVFLSYASEDFEASRRIYEALQAAGIEVWFDQNELRGGDAWDAEIRRQIKTCALFMPIISRNSHARGEGYFRLEWKLAIDRSHLIAGSVPFLLPVVIDDTGHTDDRVPERFREFQWTNLPEGATNLAFAERVKRLLSGQAPNDTLPTPDAAPLVSSPGRRLPIVGLIGALIFAVLGYWALNRTLTQHRSEPVAAQSAPADAPAASDKSIAVLPFVDLSEKHDQEYFSDGLAEELLDLLAKTPGLHVIARTSSFSFKGKAADIATIAKKLNVANVLEGSVRKSGNRVRVTTQLIRADSGEHVWSETYDREQNDVFRIQDDVATAVVTALKVRLAPGQQESAGSTRNGDAYNEYLLARQFHNRMNMQGWQHALDSFHRAIALDPEYSAAYAGLSVTEFYIANETGDAAGYQRAQDAADKAVALAPNEAEAYRARASIRSTTTWDWSGAQADIMKALALDPGDSRVHRAYSILLADLGRLPEAIDQAKKATELDPLSSAAWQNLGQYLMANHDFAAAQEANRRAREINPDSGFARQDLGYLQLLQGNGREALAAFRGIAFEGFRLPGCAMAQFTLGHAAESQAALDQMVAKYADAGPYQIAMTYAWRGEKDKAFQWLERAYAARDGGIVSLKFEPLFASLRTDARFKSMLRKLNLPT